MTTPGSRNIVSCPPAPVSPGRELGQCAGVLGHNGTIHLLECSWLRCGTWRAGREGGEGDLEDINTDRDPPGLNDQIKYN